MIGIRRRVSPHSWAVRFAFGALTIALGILPTVASVAAQPATPGISQGVLVAAELPAMMLTPSDLDEAGLTGATVGGGQTFTRLADAVASESFGLSRGLLRLSVVSTSESVLADAGWRRFHERRLGTPTADSPPRFAVEADSGVESFATAQGAAAAFAFYVDPQVSLRMSPVENLPADDPPTIGDESALWQIRGKTSDTGQQYRGLSLWFRTGSLIASVAVFDYENGDLPSRQLVEAMGGRFLARIDDVRQSGGPGLGDRVLRLGGEAITTSRDYYRLMNGELFPQLGEAADDVASRTANRDQFGMTNDYYFFAEVAAGSRGTDDDRSYSIALMSFDDATGASGYLAGFPDRLRDADYADLEFPTGAPTIGDESIAATWAIAGGDGSPRRYIDVLFRVDREILRLRIRGPELIDWPVVEALATAQIDCLQNGECLDALRPPAELLA